MTYSSKFFEGLSEYIFDQMLIYKHNHFLFIINKRLKISFFLLAFQRKHRDSHSCTFFHLVGQYEFQQTYMVYNKLEIHLKWLCYKDESQQMQPKLIKEKKVKLNIYSRGG